MASDLLNQSLGLVLEDDMLEMFRVLVGTALKLRLFAILVSFFLVSLSSVVLSLVS